MVTEGLRETDPRRQLRPEGYGDEEVFCPFCLTKDQRRRFEICLRSGKVSKEKKCPRCQKIFYDSSLLTSQTTIQKYAKFVVEYPAWFRVIDYGQWSARLKELGFASEFWEAYRELKPKDERILDKTWD